MISALLAFTFVCFFSSCSNEKEQPEPERKKLRLRVKNLDIPVKYKFTYVDKNHQYWDHGMGNIPVDGTKHIDIPKEAERVLLTISNTVPLSTKKTERMEYKANLTITDYSGNNLYEGTQVSSAILETKDGIEFYTPNSTIFWVQELKNYY